MRDSLVAKRYARALQNLIPENNLEVTSSILEEICCLFENEKISKVLRSPVISGSIKKEILSNACDQMKAEKGLKDFLNAVVAAGRVNSLPSIATSFKRISDEAQNIVRAKVISAIELDDQSISFIKATLNENLGKNIAIDSQVDPSILGGVIVEIDSSKIDMSLKTKIDYLAQSALS